MQRGAKGSPTSEAPWGQRCREPAFPPGVSSHQDGHLEEGPRLCDLGTTVDSNTARQTPREWCARGPPLRSHPNAAVEAGDASAGVEVVRQSGKTAPGSP